MTLTMIPKSKNLTHAQIYKIKIMFNMRAYHTDLCCGQSFSLCIINWYTSGTILQTKRTSRQLLVGTLQK